MTAEERAALAAVCTDHPGPYEVYTYEKHLFDPLRAWGFGVPGVWDVFIADDELPVPVAQLQGMIAKANAVPALLEHIRELEAERGALRVVAHAAMQVIAVSDGVVTWEIEHDALSNALRELGEVPS